MMQCRPEIRIEQQNEAQAASDTLEITAFDIKRENNSAKLAGWVVFEAGQEIICAPPGWKAHIKEFELIISPPNNTDSIEHIAFARFDKDSDSLDYNILARELAEKAFDEFFVQKNDTLSKLVFQRNFAYERSANFIADEVLYKSHCIIYVDDKLVYQFRIILSGDRLEQYRGDLFKDIIGNLQINGSYIIGNNNPLKQLILFD